MSRKVIVTIGLPASGKTTWSKAWVEKDPENRVRISRDEIRETLGGNWCPRREQFVKNLVRRFIIEAVVHGYDVVLDATNIIGVTRVQRWLQSMDVEVYGKSFLNVPLKTCIQRDQQRKDMVGKDVIMDMYQAALDTTYNFKPYEE